MREKIGTKYLAINVARKASPLSVDEDQMNEWLNFIVQNPLPDQVIFYDYDRIASAYGKFNVADNIENKQDVVVEKEEVVIEASDDQDDEDIDVAEYIAKLRRAKG